MSNHASKVLWVVGIIYLHLKVKVGLITKDTFNSGVGGSPEMSENWKRTSCHGFSDMSPLDKSCVFLYTFTCLRRTLYKMAHIFMKQRILAQTYILDVTHIHLTKQNGFVRHYH